MTESQPLEEVFVPDKPMLEVWRMFFANKAAVLGLALWIFIVLTAFLGPVIYPVDPFDMVGAPMSPPGEELLLGTDYLGRDVLAGIIHGASITLAIGFSATIVTAIIGLIIGVLAGYYGGWVDNLLMRFTEFFQVLPALLFAMVLGLIFVLTNDLVIESARTDQTLSASARQVEP